MSILGINISVIMGYVGFSPHYLDDHGVGRFSTQHINDNVVGRFQILTEVCFFLPRMV